MAVNKDIVIEQGQDFRLRNCWRNKITKEPIDLTGCSIYLQARAATLQTSPLLIDFSTVTGEIALAADPTTGVFDIFVPAADLYLLTSVPAEPLAPASRAIFEMGVVFTGGEVIVLRRGNIVFKPTVLYL